jgi:hypothetical protein
MEDILYEQNAVNFPKFTFEVHPFIVALALSEDGGSWSPLKTLDQF